MGRGGGGGGGVGERNGVNPLSLSEKSKQTYIKSPVSS